MRIGRDSIAARKPALRPGLELISVMGRPATTLLRAGCTQEEIEASLAGIWRTCLELNQPLRMDFSKHVPSQWVPEPEPEPEPEPRSLAVQKPVLDMAGCNAGSDDDDDLAKLQREAKRISQEDQDLERLESSGSDTGLDRTTSATLRDVEEASRRLDAKLAATQALLDGNTELSDGAGLVFMDADRTMSREGASRLAALDDMFAGSCADGPETNGDEQVVYGAAKSTSSDLLDELDTLAGEVAADQRANRTNGSNACTSHFDLIICVGDKLSQGQSPTATATLTTEDTATLLEELEEISATMPSPPSAPVSGGQEHLAKAQHKRKPPPPPPSPLRGSLGQIDANAPGVSV